MCTHESPVTEINIDRIMRKKAGRKSWLVPRWLTRWLEKLIHQDFINAYLRQERTGMDFFRGTLEYLDVEILAEGRENLPPKGEWCIFVSNHPLGAIDSVALGWMVGEAYDGHVRFLANDLLMNIRGLAPYCVPVNKMGRQSRSLPQMVDNAFSGENHTVMFPAGLCSRMTDSGEIRDLEWKKTFIIKSVQQHRRVIPMHFLGQNSMRFYRIARWCSRLHLPNLAMALLPDEMYRSQHTKYTVRIGKPIPWQTFDHTRTPSQWAQWVKEKTYET